MLSRKMFNKKIITYSIIIGSLTGMSIASAIYLPFNFWFVDLVEGNKEKFSYDESLYNRKFTGFWISGTFWTEKVGTGTFDPGTRIIPSASGKMNDLWIVVWSATSKSSGRIVFDMDGVQSLKYNPNNKKLIGHWSNMKVWVVPFNDRSIILNQ